MKKFQVDRGAIKFVLAGANIMCPGLTSPGGALNDEVLEETPVVNFLSRHIGQFMCSLLYRVLETGLINSMLSLQELVK